MGSMHEIGFFEGSIKEDTPCNPTTPYGIAKNGLRQLTEMFCKQKGKKFMWLRGYYIVGNSKYGSSIFSKITNTSKPKARRSFRSRWDKISSTLLIMRTSVSRSPEV